MGYGIFTLLLGIFLLLGGWLALLLPFLQGPDEQIHYATIQKWAEPEEKPWTVRESREINKSDDIRTYRISEEVRETAHRLQFDEIKWQANNTQSFVSGSPYGEKESEITNNTWGRYIDTVPANTSGTWSLYYWIGSAVERAFDQLGILYRLFLSRFLSVLIGAATACLAFLIGRRLGWSTSASTLFASLIAFQPMFLATSAVINIDILLVFSSTLFLLGAIDLLQDQRPTAKSISTVLTAIVIALFTKGPGVILIPLTLLLAFFIVHSQYSKKYPDLLPRSILGVFVITSLAFIFIPSHILSNFLHLGASSVFETPFASLSAYLEKSLSLGSLIWTSTTYWGSFGWLDTNLPESILRIILAVETTALFGLIWLFRDPNPPHFLPEKRTLLFALASIVLLQIAIRFFDWRILDTTGKMLSGTPARYFLPNIAAHFLLLVAGLGYFARSEGAFSRLLHILSALLFLLALYSFWFLILPRYYL